MHLFNKVNAWLEVKTKINKIPFNALLLVFLLFQHKHVMVKELLKFLISVVDTQLLKRVVLENLKTSNIQYTNEVRLPFLLQKNTVKCCCGFSCKI